MQAVRAWSEYKNRAGASSKIDAICGSYDPSKHSHIVGGPTISSEHAFGQVRSLFTVVVDILVIPVDSG
jgi:hypothetical protein